VAKKLDWRNSQQAPTPTNIFHLALLQSAPRWPQLSTVPYYAYCIFAGADGLISLQAAMTAPRSCPCIWAPTSICCVTRGTIPAV
jgi:hypothetical protein